MSITETMDWMRAWMADPLRVGAVVPSGRSLARLITAEISTDSGPIIELGAGTGAFTRALLERGVDERQLALVEGDSTFAQQLALRYPRAHTLVMDAASCGPSSCSAPTPQVPS